MMGFSEHPVQYSCSVAKKFVSDYWDLGALVLAGFAFNDKGSEVFGDARVPVMLTCTLAGFYGAQDTNRTVRNLYGGFASLTAFWSRGMDAPLRAELANYGLAGLLAVASLYLDRNGKSRASTPENCPTVEMK